MKPNHSKTGAVVGQGTLLQAAPAASTPIRHFSVKAGALNVTKNSGNQLTLQPMSMALPIMQQAGLGSQPGAQTHTLLLSTAAAEGNGAQPTSLPNS